MTEDRAKDYLNQIKSQSFFDDKTTRGSLRYNVDWYRRKALQSHVWFRIVGFLTVFLSVSLPFALKLWPEPKIVEGNSVALLGLTPGNLAAVLSWLIALAGGASGFFQWGRSWQSRTEAYLRLERLLMEWEIAVHSPQVTIDQISAATKKMVTEARETIKAETSAFFEEVQFPEVDAPPED